LRNSPRASAWATTLVKASNMCKAPGLDVLRRE